MRISCKYCGRTHEVGAECTKKPKSKYYLRYERNSPADKFRRGGSWRRMAAIIRERDMNCCRVCLELGDKYGTYSGSTVKTDGLSVHHIVPLMEDYERRLDEDNLITLCSFHHELAEANKIKKSELVKLATSQINFAAPLGG